MREFSQNSGRVYLVGAGPGDPELLTLKAVRVLQTADIVLHDELVSAAILALISPHARVHNVGKRCGRRSTLQQEINDLMVENALSGATVVRLKGGDPQVFGHAWEEIATLRAAGVEFDIVPGITAALASAAAAQVPLTARSLAPGVVFVTYRRAPSAPEIRWKELLASNLTIVVYMPGENYGTVATELRNAGLGGETPCAVVSRASTPEETVQFTNVHGLALTAALAPPALLIIGEVARLDKTSPAFAPAIAKALAVPNLASATAPAP